MDPVDVTGRNETIVVQRALERLAPGQRDIVELGYFEGLSLAEIAARLGTPIGTTKSRLARALASMREDLASLEREEPDAPHPLAHPALSGE